MKKVYGVILAMVAISPNVGMSDSLLAPAEFPKTVNDLSFSDKLQLAQESYEPFFGLSPYEALEIIETDAGIADEIAADEQQTTPDPTTPPTTTPPTTTPTTTPPTTQPPATTPPTTPVPPTIINPGTPGNNGNYNCANYNREIPAGQRIPLGRPVRMSDYRACSKYGWRKFGTRSDFHHGFDIGCTLKHYDQPVFTSADGVVERVQPNRKGSSAGNYIVIKHDNGFTTKYMHLNQMLVKKGEHVRAGCQIATIGNTGGAKINRAQFADNPYPTMSKNGAHLHYEIHYTGQSPISIRNKVINVEWGRTNNPGTVKDYSINPEPFMLF